mmetsp:Transcript_13851/g.35348  ORF Transcript_13851/g.35348 Transcript_13851/m.35348 type:complete len:106 (-) Transcript_13851:20-337(-)
MRDSRESGSSFSRTVPCNAVKEWERSSSTSVRKRSVARRVCVRKFDALESAETSSSSSAQDDDAAQIEEGAESSNNKESKSVKMARRSRDLSDLGILSLLLYSAV